MMLDSRKLTMTT